MPNAKKTSRRKNGALHAVHPGDFLRRQFMEPMGLTADQLGAGLKTDAIIDVLRGKRGIDGELALRLGKFFRTSAEFWMNAQNTYDLRTAANEVSLTGIRPVRVAPARRAHTA